MSQTAKSRLVVGLGNPGERYRDTRHNLGFKVVAEIARERSLKLDRQQCNSLLSGEGRLRLAQPLTFMNRSGYAVRCLVERYGYGVEEILVVYDDLDLPLGKLRLRGRGGPGGHRGMESVLQSLRTDEVPRLRIGISPEGPPPAGGSEEVVDFVLSSFTAEEEAAASRACRRAAQACLAWAEEGLEAAMRRFNV